jgi:predicted RNase H-like HicB family nuclease
LPGCVATGKTRAETERNMHATLEMHIYEIFEDKLPIPENVTFAEHIAIAA